MENLYILLYNGIVKNYDELLKFIVFPSKQRFNERCFFIASVVFG